MFDLDRWREIFQSINKNKLRSVMSGFTVAFAILLFTLLWKWRTRFSRPLQLFGCYLMLNGAERFFVELIRVNSQYDWGFLHPTQAEIIAVCLMSIGAYFFFRKEQKIQIP